MDNRLPPKNPSHFYTKLAPWPGEGVHPFVKSIVPVVLQLNSQRKSLHLLLVGSHVERDNWVGGGLHFRSASPIFYGLSFMDKFHSISTMVLMMLQRCDKWLVRADGGECVEGISFKFA